MGYRRYYRRCSDWLCGWFFGFFSKRNSSIGNVSEAEEHVAFLLLKNKIPFQREYVLWKEGRSYGRYDFYIPNLKLLIEVQGGIFMGRGHTSGNQMLRDMRKLNKAQKMGYNCFQIPSYNQVKLTGNPTTKNYIARSKLVFCEYEEYLLYLCSRVSNEPIAPFRK